MRSFLFSLFLLAGWTATAHAQCEKKYLITSSRTEYIEADGKSSIRPESVVMELSPTDIRVTLDNNLLTGSVRNLKCSWTEALRNGKTSFDTELFEESGHSRDAHITIEALDGKVTVLVDIPSLNGKKLKLLADKMEEK